MRHSPDRFAGDAAARTATRHRHHPDVIAADHLPLWPRILDIPCGTGRHANALAREGFDVIGLDLQPAYLHTARAEGAATYRRRRHARPAHRGPAASTWC